MKTITPVGCRGGFRLFVFFLAMLWIGLSTGCADLHDQPADEEAESTNTDSPTNQVDAPDSITCVEGPCADDGIWETEMRPGYYFDDDSSDDGSSDDGSSDDGSSDDGSSDDGSSDDGSSDDGSSDDGSSDDGSSDDGSSDDGSSDDGSSDDGESGYCDLEDPLTECPSSQGYWKNHPDEWPDSIADDCSDTDEQGCLCGLSWMEILQTPPADSWDVLAQQWVAAAINAEINACTSESEEYLLIGESLLEDCTIADDDQDLAEEMTGRLDLFNTGELTPSCSQ